MKNSGWYLDELASRAVLVGQLEGSTLKGVLVHLTPSIPADYVYSAAILKAMPRAADFRGDVRDERSTQAFGQWWAAQGSELAIRVPSVVIPSEENVLLNPTHSELSELSWDSAEPFRFDERLLSPP